MKWTSKTYRLREGHGWKAKPGHNIFVAYGGAIRFDVPEDWVCVPRDASFQLYNRPQPDDDCRLECSVLFLQPGIDWRELSITQVLREALPATFRDALTRGDIVHQSRPDLELAWAETSYFDPPDMRLACTRTCLARRTLIQTLITMDFWRADAERFAPVWDEVLRSLQLGVFVKDPTHRGLN